MIESLRVQNLRGIANAEIDGMTPITIFVGANGSGKSTLIDAIFVAKEGSQALDFIQMRRPENPNSLSWTIHKPQINKSAICAVKDDKLGVSECHIDVNNGGSSVGMFSGNMSGGDHSIFVNMKLTPRPNHENGYSGRGIGNGGFGGNLLAEADRSYISFDGKMKLLDLSKKISLNSLVNLYSDAVKNGLRKDILEYIKNIIPKLENIEILVESGTPSIHFVYPSHSIPASLSGDGLYSLLRLCIEYVMEEGGAVLLEEPEIHQYPATMKQVAKLLRSAAEKNIQTIMTTHSIEFIDFILNEMQSGNNLDKLSLYMVKLDDGNLSAARISGESIEVERHTIGADLR